MRKAYRNRKKQATRIEANLQRKPLQNGALNRLNEHHVHDDAILVLADHRGAGGRHGPHRLVGPEEHEAIVER